MSHLPSKDRNYLKYIGLALLANIIWGGAGSVIKYTEQFIPPFSFLYIRFLLVCIILLPITIWYLSKDKVNRKDYFNIILLGLTSQAALMLLFVALKYTLVLDTIIIGVLGNILAVYVGHYLYNERFDFKMKLGLIFASIGTLIVVIEPILSQSSATDTAMLHRLFGNLLVLLYSFSFLFYLVWSKISLGNSNPRVRQGLKILHLKPMTKNYSPILLSCLTFYVGLIAVIPFAVLENSYLQRSFFTGLNLQAYAGLFYMVLLSSIVAYFSFEYALKRISVSDNALLSYLQPILAVPFAFLIQHEIPTMYHIIGGIFITLGVLIAEYHKIKTN